VRTLVVGAGAVGGYFGGRMLEAHRDVTFLVRPRRAAALARSGLRIRSHFGNATLGAPPVVLASGLTEPYDLVLLACKAYDLDVAIESFAPAVGPQTTVLPLLNGMRHMDVLGARFGASRLLGGLCVISSSLDPDGTIAHVNEAHDITFGEPDGGPSIRAEAVAAELAPARCVSRLSPTILQEMWEKWVFIATGAGIGCLMRGAVGDIVAAGGAELVERLLAECAGVAARAGFPPRDVALERARATFTAAGSPFTASMLRDIERGSAIEGEHIVGDLRRRGDKEATFLLGVVEAHLRAYEARRHREATAKPGLGLGT
jgi:2-dehydropantoate 2-reductase